MHRGFTLAELLIVITIIAILTALITTAVRASILQSKKAVCINRLADIGHATMLYEADHNGYLPPQSFYGLPQERAPVGIDVPSAAKSYASSLAIYGLPSNALHCVAAKEALTQGVEDSWPPKLGTILLSYRMTTRFGEPPVQRLIGSSNIAWNVRLNVASIPETAQTVSHYEFIESLPGGTLATSYHGSPANGLYLDGHVTRLQSKPHTMCWFPGVEDFLGIPPTNPCFK
jgi:prepilin-type N-terminal cleavage/methylation domain-containing protein/prepilin-type processing-associated H-X9-DG protein